MIILNVPLKACRTASVIVSREVLEEIRDGGRRAVFVRRCLNNDRQLEKFLQPAPMAYDGSRIPDLVHLSHFASRSYTTPDGKERPVVIKDQVRVVVKVLKDVAHPDTGEPCWEVILGDSVDVGKCR